MYLTLPQSYACVVVVCSNGLEVFRGGSGCRLSKWGAWPQYCNGSGSVNLYMAHGGSSWGFWSGALHACCLLSCSNRRTHARNAELRDRRINAATPVLQTKRTQALSPTY